MCIRDRHYCIELARRGYVAIGVDMYGMGESEPLPDSEWPVSYTHLDVYKRQQQRHPDFRNVVQGFLRDWY